MGSLIWQVMSQGVGEVPGLFNVPSSLSHPQFFSTHVQCCTCIHCRIINVQCIYVEDTWMQALLYFYVLINPISTVSLQVCSCNVPDQAAAESPGQVFDVHL